MLTHASMLKRVQKVVVEIALYVDNNLIVGNIEVIDDIIAASKKRGQYKKSWKG